MKYKTKLIFLTSLIAGLVLILIASFIFDPKNMNTRTSLYTWLDKKWIDQADRIVVKGTGLASETTTLIRRNNIWYVLAGNTEYPAKQERVQNLFDLLSTKAPYPVRANSESSHEKLGVTERVASRIAVYGGISQIPLLDLLIGSGDSTGNEIYLRENGKKEVRSGADQFTNYSDSKQSTWFYLRMISDDPKPVTPGMVQRVTITSAEQHLSYTLSRYADDTGSSWRIDSSPAMVPDTNRVETYVRSLVNIEGAGFAVGSAQDDYRFTFGKAELVLEDLSRVTILFGPELENGQYPAMVSGGNPFVYLIPMWVKERTFREPAYFEAEE